MSKVLDLTTDWHTHTDRSDGSATLQEMVQTAAGRGLRRLHVTDQVRATTTWVPDYVTEIARVRAVSPIEIVSGVEAKLLDVRGALDLPDDLAGIDQVTISDHQFPTRTGPITPEEMGRRIAAGEIRAADAVGDLVLATSRAVLLRERVVVGHLFSALPKAGIHIDEVTGEMLSTLAAALRETGSSVEVNEKWRTPTFAHVRALCGLAVELVPASDAHSPADLGAWDYVTQAAAHITS